VHFCYLRLVQMGTRRPSPSPTPLPLQVSQKLRAKTLHKPSGLVSRERRPEQEGDPTRGKSRGAPLLRGIPAEGRRIMPEPALSPGLSGP
jgi:hypothetical protein